MSGWEAACPACGASLVFSLGSSLLRVCDHCGVAVARRGTDLSKHGRVAELIPTPSVLALGLEGRYQGAPPFRLAGRLQVDHGAGTWDEWLMAFADGNWAWLSEAQGRFHYMGQAALPPVARHGEVRAGDTLDLGPPGTFVVTEVRTARFMSAQGELPFVAEPGGLLHYVDLSGPGGQFATLDYGAGETAEALFVGREVALGDLGFRDLPDEEARRHRTGGQTLSCTQCGGPVEIRVPDQSQRVACSYCGSLLDVTKGLAVLDAVARVAVQPLVPLGSKGRFAGAEWTLIGFMERSVTVEGVRYPWREYLLYEPRRGFRWLVEANGHWSFVEPVHAGDVKGPPGGARPATWQGKTFKHFQSGQARVDHVLGEFYWEVARGDLVQTDDYVSPPLMLSTERDASEVNWSLGTYTTPEEVQEAFRLDAAPTRPTGVAPHQPWPWAAQARSVYSRSLMFLAILLLAFVVLNILGGRTVHQASVPLRPGLVSGSPEAAVFTDPFDINRPGNLEVRVQAPVDNSWLHLDGALINEETGAVDAFDLEVSYYHGRDSDGSWSEGGTSARSYLASVPSGRYVLRLAPQWETGRAPGSYDLRLRSRVPRFHHFVLAGLALCAWPLVLLWKHMRFEIERWSESDHPWVESSE